MSTMHTFVHRTTDGQVAVLEIDNPPVNAVSTPVVAELAGAITAADQDAGVTAIVIACAGRTFVAGADVKELEAAARGDGGPPELHDLLARIEDTSKPVVMALHGTALGGGVELAMAGHYRVAAGSARLGMPELTLGIIPGAEGTQRLPRLVGLEEAIALCLSARPIDAATAERIGLVDRVVDGDVRPGAIAFAREVAASGGPHPKTRERQDKLGLAGDQAALEAGRAEARGKFRNVQAPFALLDALEASQLPFDQGIAREREIRDRQMQATEAKASMHAFFAERAVARVPGLPADARPIDVARVAIIGAGTMGAGISMACANADLDVLLIDVEQAALDRGLATIRRNYDSSIRRGRLTQAQVDERLARIATAVGYERLGEADLVIEAVFESLDLKRQVFGDIDRRARPGAVLATNTSTLDIDRIADATKRPEAVIGLHFFSPAHIMRLVEIVRGRRTSAETIATALSIARRLRKVGVVVGNGTGFVGNRMMFPYMYEAQFLAEDGATPEQVDGVLRDFGMAMGIFAVDDMGGLDVAWRIRKELGQFDDPARRAPLVADKLVDMGRLGQKAGRGWFRYGDDRKPQPDPDVVALIERTAQAAGITRRPVDDTEIRERTIYALINEGAKVLEDGIAARAADIDVIYLTGYGFPRYRGGPMFYADTVGLGPLCDRLTAFERDLGPRWAVAPLIRRLANAGPGEPRTFREYDASRQEP